MKTTGVGNAEDVGEAILSAACFRLGMLGARVTRDFSERIAPSGLTHKQVGLLAVVDAGLASSQRDIATRLHVAPSLVVTLVDQLVDLGAVSKTRSRNDRRTHKIEVTPEGRHLLASAVVAAEALDADIRSILSPAGRAALSTLLTELDMRQNRNQ
ncbi:winged helix-turn-helix transcriptional regulator [Actinomyces sp. 594]|uniref:MarR family winged helix-turn-helix transcriptional regulator n=1 Tax=Actinomyces sp. 594 TaxID=2057793 RepID=UPI001C584952|nr:MarR family winged helix-turn-helix transcriptional regulator [Actinomyces sp. 594]MBW3068691.1 winged helix-turn-helix transcriptional regulator [Actinomyces sp. 594]